MVSGQPTIGPSDSDARAGPDRSTAGIPAWHFWRRSQSGTQFLSPYMYGRHGNISPHEACVSSQQILGVLSQDGVMRFINIHTCKLLFHVGSPDDTITTVAVSPNGRHVVAIMDNGSINVYSIQSLRQESNKVDVSWDTSQHSAELMLISILMGCVCIHTEHVCVCCPHPASSLPGGSRLWWWRWSGMVQPEGQSQVRGPSETSQELRQENTGEDASSPCWLCSWRQRGGNNTHQSVSPQCASWNTHKVFPLLWQEGVSCICPVSANRMNYLLVWTRRDWWLCSSHMESILLNTGH